MGLDISYYSKIKESKEIEDDFYPSIYTSSNGYFIYQLGSLKKDAPYELTEESEDGSFRAGSYSGYGEWRNKLSVMAGYGDASDVWKDFGSNIRYCKLKKINGEEFKMKPFYELICFSDCEGVIGPEISKKLYQDFLDFDEKAKDFQKNNTDFYPSPYQGDYFYQLYQNWKEAFRVASEYGAVFFH